MFWNSFIMSPIGLLLARFSFLMAGTKSLTRRLLASRVARVRTLANASASAMLTATSARSRTIDSTSRPT